MRSSDATSSRRVSVVERILEMEPNSMWRCPKCGTNVDAGFEICWECGTSVDGVEDPAFYEEEAIPVASDDGPGDDDRTNERLVAVATYNTLHEAHSLRLLLESEGIPAKVDGEFAVPVSWLLPQTFSHIRVLVFESDQKRASELKNDKLP